jgi:hypothetical protein
MRHLDAKPNRNGPENHVVHLRFAAVVSAGCMVPAAVRHPVSTTGIIDMARALKKPPRQ